MASACHRVNSEIVVNDGLLHMIMIMGGNFHVVTFHSPNLFNFKDIYHHRRVHGYFKMTVNMGSHGYAH
jgi:hypothetical protein